jgi:hypothetical protein
MPTPSRVPPCWRLDSSDSLLCQLGAAAARRNRTSTTTAARTRRRSCREDPGVLECRLQIFARQAGDHAGNRVGQRHRQHVHQREHEGTPGGDVLALADDDARQDRDHREHAGREDSSRPKPKKVGNRPAHPHRICPVRLARHHEGLIGEQELVLGDGSRADRQDAQGEGEQACPGDLASAQAGVVGRVHWLTQFRYSGSPAVIGRAMISGRS